ncbi:hypothetical protein K2Z84_00530 [Candidatus Binatia bacterium]|jgi:hypothetical protein|nr:hypothetical protein [Candidatus Binatia bacterium]
MRTTVDIDERTLERAKKLAASTGRTLGEVVGAALAAYAAGRAAARGGEPFELVVRGRPGARFPSASEIAEVLEDEDVAGLAGRRRASS